ncbi:MAG: TlpA family protein disulfide reductase [Solirubrobacteraceae bacterium]
MKRLGWSGSVAGAMLVVAFLGLGYALFQGRADDAPDSLPVGEEMPPFATPLVRSDLEGDANVATREDQGAAGARPACEVRGPAILNGCQLAERGPVVLTFVAQAGSCMDQLRALEQLKRAEPGLQVAAIAIKGDRDKLREELDRRQITIPVGWDRDGALSAVYRVLVCPQTVFADQGGRVSSTAYEELTAGELRRRTGTP